MRAWMTFASVLLVGSLAWVFGRLPDEKPAVEIGQLSEANWEQLVPRGKEVDAIYGDFVLRNKHLTAVIAAPLATRNANMTVKEVGGCLIDLTARPNESDQLSAFYPGARRFAYRSAVARGDGAAVDLSKTPIVRGSTGEITVIAEPGEGKPKVEVTYRLAADATLLTIVSKFTNTGETPLRVPLTDDFRLDHGKEEVVKSSDGESDVYWIHDIYWGQAYGWLADGARIVANSTTRGATFQYAMPDDKPSVTIEPGKSVELTRHIAAAPHLPDLRATIAAARQQTSSVPIELIFLDGANRPVPKARVELFRNGHPWGIVPTDAQGMARTLLPNGEYELEVSAFGTPVVGKDQRRKFKVAGRESPTRWQFTLEQHLTGSLAVQITDSDGQPLPCKVEIAGQGDTPTPSFGPETADFAVKNLVYCPLGVGEQELPAGQYEVIVSHGPEFDALFTTIAIRPGQKTTLAGKLARSVHTPGWVSTDFHSHSTPSGDNTGSQLGRVVNLVCEHVEFAPCTEHNRIDTYLPHIQRLNVGRFISSCSGIELTGTPLPLNHQNAFPLQHKPRTQDGGGPLTDVDPVTQIERLAMWDDRADKLVQINHPDFGWMTYDRDGDGKPDDGFQRMFAQMDVVEVHPIHTLLTFQPTYRYKNQGKPIANRVFHWLQLLNQGLRLPGVINTDAHYNFHGSGGLRNWVQSPTDDPAAVVPLDIVHAAEQGRVILSNGPYLEVSLTETGKPKSVTAGEGLDVKSGQATLAVRVQCPNWFDIDRVVVLVNGRPHATHDYRKATHPDRFRSGNRKFDEKLALTLAEDAHVIVVAAGDKPLGKVAGPDWGHQTPTAISNPIYLDVDGDGFRANKDTLGQPLPVKFEAK